MAADIDALIQKIRSREWQDLDSDTLLELQNPETRADLIDAMHEKDYFVPRSIVWALCQVGEAAKPDLLRALRDDDWKVRYATVDSIWHLQDTSIVPDLIVALHDPEPLVRMAAAESLGGLGGDTAVIELIQALGDDDGDVYVAAVRALRDIIDEGDISELHPLLTSENLKLRMAAAYVLGANGGLEALPGLFDVLRTGFTRDRSELERVEEETIKLGKSAVPYLLQILEETDDDKDEAWIFKRTAMHTLGEIGDVHAIPALIVQLKSEDRDLWQPAVWALGGIGSAALPTFETILKDGPPDIQAEAIDTLAKMPDVSPERTTILLKSIEDQDARMRGHALWGFRSVTDQSVIPKIIERLHDTDHSVQWTAATILQDHFPTPEALKALEEWRREQKR